MPPRALFISGTDTDAGKTHVVCELIRLLRQAGQRVQPFKPLCTGVTPDDAADIGRLADAAEVTPNSVRGETFAAPLSPPSASRLERRGVAIGRLDDRLRELALDSPDVILVEGAGGLLCPVTSTLTMRDLVQRWKLPMCIVAGVKLGAINHTLLTLSAADAVGLNPFVILSEPRAVEVSVWDSTVSELAERVGDRIVGVMRNGGRLLQFSPATPTIQDDQSTVTPEQIITWCQPLADDIRPSNTSSC